MTSAHVLQQVRLSRADHDTAAAVLARAFWDDPMCTYIVPDDTTRASLLPSFFKAAVLIGDKFGEVWTSAGQVEGAAIWLPPGGTDLTDEHMAAAGIDEIAAKFGDEAMGRFGAVMESLSDHHHANMAEAAHWYLLVLGVEPARQGMGIGRQVATPVLERADEAGLPCYLETMKRRNLAIYRRLGFEVVSEGDTPDGDLHFWTMLRPPRN